VRADSTLICLHAGSFECIGVRHRATQQLYLSDLIHTHTCKDPGYGKLHVGLYIADLEDVIDCAMQMKEEDKPRGRADNSDEGNAKVVQHDRKAKGSVDHLGHTVRAPLFSRGFPTDSCHSSRKSRKHCTKRAFETLFSFIFDMESTTPLSLHRLSEALFPFLLVEYD
jgi:hypothetical protein